MKVLLPPSLFLNLHTIMPTRQLHSDKFTDLTPTPYYIYKTQFVIAIKNITHCQ